MNNTEQSHRHILQKKIVNKNDLNDISVRVLGQKDTQYLQRKYLSRLQKDHKIGKIKKGLYYGIPLEKTNKDFDVDRYILANKIHQGCALGYHSALELYGAAYSATNIIYILIQKECRFTPFHFQKVEYKPVINNIHTKHLKKIVYKDTKITITDPARTFIECLDRLDLSGGWEECLKSLANLKGINILDLKDVLSIYDNKTLELKTGYVLELLSRSSPFYEHIKPADLQVLKPSDTWIPVYLDRDVPSKFIKKWGLYIPEGTDDLLRGI